MIIQGGTGCAGDEDSRRTSRQKRLNCGTLDSSEEKFVILLNRWSPQTKQEEDSLIKPKICYIWPKRIERAMLEGVGTVHLLEREAWSIGT